MKGRQKYGLNLIKQNILRHTLQSKHTKEIFYLFLHLLGSSLSLSTNRTRRTLPRAFVSHVIPHNSLKSAPHKT